MVTGMQPGRIREIVDEALREVIDEQPDSGLGRDARVALDYLRDHPAEADHGTLDHLRLGLADKERVIVDLRIKLAEKERLLADYGEQITRAAERHRKELDIRANEVAKERAKPLQEAIARLNEELERLRQRTSELRAEGHEVGEEVEALRYERQVLGEALLNSIKEAARAITQTRRELGADRVSATFRTTGPVTNGAWEPGGAWPSGYSESDESDYDE